MLKMNWWCCFVVCISPALQVLGSERIDSPDGRLVLVFELKQEGAKIGVPFYHVECQGKTVLADSRLGLDLESGPLNEGFEIVSIHRSSSRSTWKPVCGERTLIKDNFSELTVDLKEIAAPFRRLRLDFRTYNEGAAFAYTLIEQEGFTNCIIRAENTQFRFTGDYKTWAVYQAQGYYDSADERQKKDRLCGEVKLSQVQPGVERPLTVQVDTSLYAAITEARLVDYARMKLGPVSGHPHTLGAVLDGEKGANGTVEARLPFTSPWRVILVATSPGGLLEGNDLILNLNEPCALKDTSWIKPGKVIRESSLSTQGGKACVDFAVRQGLQFVEYDAGWYGNEYDPASDARRVQLDPKRNPNPNALNLQEVINYANSRGIGVILYVNRLALEKQLDEILPLYQSWGVKGVKYGFVSVGSQKATRWLHEAVRKAANHRLMVDIHDEYRSTGYQRTYPNLMTVEGVAGNEAFPTPVHNATLPFTRYLTGPADYTYCWYSGRLSTTHAHQLAISTIFFSPWQFLFWYDVPGNYDGDKALDYWKQMPTTWDDTRVLKGEIGREVCIARRKGPAWFIGAIRPEGKGIMEIPLSILAKGDYVATIYRDQAPEAPTSKKVHIEQRTVNRSTVLRIALASNGGVAMHIAPVDSSSR